MSKYLKEKEIFEKIKKEEILETKQKMDHMLNMAEIRRNSDYSLRAMAEICECSHQHINNCENGDTFDGLVYGLYSELF